MQYPYPNTWQEYPNLPWIHFQAASGGGFYVRCMQTGQQAFTSNMDGVHQFAADHSHGVGTYIHKVTQAAGIPRCGACARRQAAMNGGLGSFFKKLFS